MGEPAMTDAEIEKIHADLLKEYPGANLVTTEDKNEMIAEIEPGFAVAVIKNGLPHFHTKMTETYGVIRSELYVGVAGEAHFLRKGDSLVIEPGQIHFAWSVDEPAWIEVKSDPPWSPEDHVMVPR
jgi:quercetin dioxygenase-like cupin family protein